MSSSTLAGRTAPSPKEEKTTPNSPRQFWSGRTFIALVAVILVCVAICLAVFWNQYWPFTEKAILEDLKEASDSTVTVRKAHRTYFPFPGCVLEGLVFHHGPDKWNLITVEKLTIEGSYSGILTKRVPRIRAEGGHVIVPPLGSNVTFNTQHSNLVVEEIVADGAVIEFAAKDSSKKPLHFEVQHAVLNDVQWGKAIDFDLKFHNPEPPGEIATRGKFGAWTTGRPGETPISGEYTFEQADLGVYGGVAGMLSSKGKYGGALKHIDISGATDVPDFEVSTGKHKVRLATQYSAYVDAIHGDTFLKQVDAHFGRTDLTVAGSIAAVKGRKSKTALLDLTSRRGRIEDILRLFVSEPRAPMSGPITLKAKVEIPPGDERFLEKIKLDGAFGIDDGTFSKAETQKNVNELSAGARGDKMEDAETVLTDLKGQVVLTGGIARFSDLSFGIPGAKARMNGTFNLLNEKIDLHGFMKVDTKISKTTTGMKSFFLKVLDPIFKKKKKGEVVPVHISGTYEHPQFGLDLTQPQDKTHATH
jgi:hypothetical protein